jgi:L-lactate dehydrogenase complex protein LldG
VSELKIYSTLKDWWRFVLSVESCQEEGLLFHRLFQELSASPPRTLLELGCGGGNTASYFKPDLALTLTRNLPRPAAPLPEISGSERKGVEHGLGYKGHLPRLPEVPGFPDAGEPLVHYFRRQLEAMGGRSFEVADAAAARAKVAELFPDARVVCSAVPEVPGTRPVEDVRDPHQLNDVDVRVIRSPLGVAEAGAVWLTPTELVVNALGVLSQHLVVLLDPAAVVETVQDAYGRIDLTASPYGVFLAGPSATGDIEG